MANPRKVVALSTGKIGKQKRLNRARQEEELRLDRNELESGAPEWLDETARKEYNRVVREAGKLPMFDNLDLAVLAIYASAYSQYVEAQKTMRNAGTVVDTKAGLVPSPFINVADKAATQVLRCSSKLGLAVTDRLKLIVPTRNEKPEPNRFFEYLPKAR